MNLVFRSSRMKRKIFQGHFALATSILLLICMIAGPRASAQTLRKIVIGVSNPDNVTFFPLYFAKAAGYFREQGLETQMVVVDSDLRIELAPRTREVENAV